MLKRLFLAIIVALSPVAAIAAGTIPFSLMQQLDQYGVPLSGCQFYTIQAGTTSTPQNSYKDTALSITQPNPMACDASGRLPQFFLADGQIKIRLLDKLGNPQVVLDNILVIGPSSGGGGGGTIDPTTIASTGDIKQAYGTQVLSGWVRLNGRTIGNASSGATERANADTQALFLYLYAADTSLVVSGGRTTGTADYAANKTIALPDFRSRALAGLGDMGNTDNALFSGVTFTSGNSTTLGSLLGAARRTLSAGQIPTITSANTAAIGLNSTGAFWTGGTLVLSNGTVCCVAQNPGSALVSTNIAIGAAAVTSNNTGGAAFDSVSTYGLVTIYGKL